MFNNRKIIYKELEKTKNTKIISYFTNTISISETYKSGISNNILPFLSEHLDVIGFTKK